jgi:dolichol-phosphate mannosyltransferase
VVYADDDSPDGTVEAWREIAQAKAHVRCLLRIGRRGLSEPSLSTSAATIAVIDSDLQHDESRLPAMLARLVLNDLDVVVGSRYARRGSVGAWSDGRLAMSRIATRLSRWSSAQMCRTR